MQLRDRRRKELLSLIRSGNAASGQYTSDRRRQSALAGQTLDVYWVGVAELPAHLVFFVLIGTVDGESTKVFHQVEQALIALVPVGGNFIEKHDSLVRPT